MLANLLGHAEWIVGVLAATVAIVTKAWCHTRRTEIRERSETDRLSKALEGSAPKERAEIIRALGGRTDPRAEDKPDEPDVLGVPGSGTPERSLLDRILRGQRSQPKD